MVDDTKQEMQTAPRVGFAGEVYSPDEIARDVFWFCVFEVAAQDFDFVVVLLQDLMNVGFAYGDFAGGGKAAVADVGDTAASGLGHKRFEADDFCFEPFRFLRGMAVVVFAVRWDRLAAVVRTMRRKHPMHDALDVRVQEFDDRQSGAHNTSADGG